MSVRVNMGVVFTIIFIHVFTLLNAFMFTLLFTRDVCKHEVNMSVNMCKHAC